MSTAGDSDHREHPGRWQVRAAQPSDRPRWLALRQALWPTLPEREHRVAIGKVSEPRSARAALLCHPVGDPAAVGLAEVVIRPASSAEGAVAEIEAFFVEPDARERGAPRRLIDAVEAWARERGCAVVSCRVPLDDIASAGMLCGLGFVERQRTVQLTRAVRDPAVALHTVARPSRPPARPPASLPLAPRPSPPAGRRSVWSVLGWVAHLAAAAGAVYAFMRSDIFGGDPVRGVMLPFVGFLCTLWVLGAIVAHRYRGRTAATAERQARLFRVDARGDGPPRPPPAASG